MKKDNNDCEFKINESVNTSVCDKQKAIEWAKINIPLIQKKKQQLFIDSLNCRKE